MADTTKRFFGTLEFAGILVALVFSGPVSAEIYKWTDEHGRVHYGDKPGDNVAQEVEVEKHDEVQPNKKSINRKIKQQRLLQLFAEEREEKKKEKIDAKNEKIKLRNTCNEARHYHNRILSSGYLYDEDEAGNQRILTTEEFEQHLGETEQFIEKYCT